eukprot:9173629-Alexandrium_andersonii.AAC.1
MCIRDSSRTNRRQLRHHAEQRAARDCRVQGPQVSEKVNTTFSRGPCGCSKPQPPALRTGYPTRLLR